MIIEFEALIAKENEIKKVVEMGSFLDALQPYLGVKVKSNYSAYDKREIGASRFRALNKTKSKLRLLGF